MDFENISINTQSSIRITGSKTLYFDPIMILDELHDADIIFITHPHSDHFDPDSIKKVRKPDSILIGPVTMAEKLEQVTDKENLRLMKPEEEIEILGLHIKAYPAYNKWKPFHPQNKRWLGYLLHMAGTGYFISGDTDAVEEIRQVKCDVAMIPIGGFYTMAAKEAANLVNEIMPKAVIPTHYGSYIGKPEDFVKFRNLVNKKILVIPKLSFK